MAILTFTSSRTTGRRYAAINCEQHAIEHFAKAIATPGGATPFDDGIDPSTASSWTVREIDLHKAKEFVLNLWRNECLLLQSYLGDLQKIQYPSLKEQLVAYVHNLRLIQQRAPLQQVRAFISSINDNHMGEMKFDASFSELEVRSRIVLLLQFIRRVMRFYKGACLTCDGMETEYVGIVAPNASERDIASDKTELWFCKTCVSYYRVARYENVLATLRQRWGRCGEHSKIMWVLATALGYTCRIVLDYTDHVWVEILIGGKWIHADPSEAVLDELLMYERGWGKKFTFLFGITESTVVDVTDRYTETKEDVIVRRQMSEADLQHVLTEVNTELQQ
eukprot:GILK01009265.1.p1 GENE.GILK01009265.1~~GILK01009265.1.p1  ORF type:complete len:336 (+),score=40.10 GILK01009265.1:32-1039(+)